MAVQTAVVFYPWRVVAIDAELFGRFQNFAGAIGDTITASLATLFYDVYLTFGNVNIFCIKRYSPEFHGPFLVLFSLFSSMIEKADLDVYYRV